MELIEVVRDRRSAQRLTGPAPSDEEIATLVTAAANGPDHGLLRPWRLVLVRGEGLSHLGAAFAAGLPASDPQARERAANKPLRAPLLLSIVFCPQPSHKVPAWEQLAATITVIHNLTLLLHSHGWGVMWRTGDASRSRHVHGLLALRGGEQLLGWLYIGTPDRSRSQPPRPQIDLEDRICVLDESGSARPLFAVAESGGHP